MELMSYVGIQTLTEKQSYHYLCYKSHNYGYAVLNLSPPKGIHW